MSKLWWLSLLLCFPLWAAPLTDSQAYGILVVAYGQYKGPRTLLDNPPPIIQAKREDLCKEYGAHAGCAINAIYDCEKMAVYISDELDFSVPYTTTVLVHELIHHFQCKTRGLPRSCGEVMFRERQAYLIQAELLEKMGDYNNAYRAIKGGMMNIPNCPIDDVAGGDQRIAPVM